MEPTGQDHMKNLRRQLEDWELKLSRMSEDAKDKADAKRAETVERLREQKRALSERLESASAKLADAKEDAGDGAQRVKHELEQAWEEFKRSASSVTDTLKD